MDWIFNPFWKVDFDLDCQSHICDGFGLAWQSKKIGLSNSPLFFTNTDYCIHFPLNFKERTLTTRIKMGFSNGDPNAYVKIVCRALRLVTKDSDLADELTSIGSVELRLKHLDVTLQVSISSTFYVRLFCFVFWAAFL